MAEYDNELRGVLFRNEHKRPDKKDADYRGRATVAGVEYWLDAWVNDGQKGKYMSIKFKAKDASAAEPEPAKPQADFDDSIPF